MENKYFKKMGEVIPYDLARVELWSGWEANTNQESREETVATIASLSYGNKEAKNPSKLYERLKKLKHESLFEFINPSCEDKRIDKSLRQNSSLPFDGDWEYENHRGSIATFKIKLPLFVARQFMRHRCFSYLELSRRYTKPDKVSFEFFTPDLNDFDEEEREGFKDYYITLVDNSVTLYEKMIERGFKPEIARATLPVSLYTEFWVQGDLRCLANFFKLRLKADAQKEIRDIAQGMLKLIAEHQPELYTKLEQKEIK